MITPVLPSGDRHESAGERLVHTIAEVLGSRADLLLISRDGPSNRRALQRGGVPPHRLLRRGSAPLDRARRTLGLLPALTRRDLHGLRDALRSAEVVDLQWEENGALLSGIRRINPRARIVITLHDVISQRCARQRDLQTSRRRKAVWEARRVAAVILERQIMRHADHVVVLSEKDAALLPSRRRRAQVHAIPPAILGELRPMPPRADGPPLLLFVGFMARWENEDAMHWFVTEILPVIRRSHPQVRVAVAGGGLRPHVVDELRSHGAEVLGFVDDLEPLYAAAAAVVVPLRYGAGVKFKVVEALVRGVPTVTTSVGNEGIRPSDAARVADSATSFAEAVLGVLQDQAGAEAHARASAPRVAAEFGAPAFVARWKEVYG